MKVEDLQEATIGPPKFPLVTKINLSILDFVFQNFIARFLPAYHVEVTSEFRDAIHNAKIGGAANSAHVHGLARDFVLFFKDGKAVPRSQAKQLFEEFIKPNWPGFSLWEESPNAKPEGYHVHVNLSRRITTYAGLLSLGVVGFGAYKFWEGFKNGK